MEPKDLVDLEALAESVAPRSTSIFDVWAATAQEACPNKYRQIAEQLKIWNEITPQELRPPQVEAFADTLLRLMDSDDERKKWVNAEAFHFRRFEP